MVLVDPQRIGGLASARQLLQEALDIAGDAATARLDATPAGRAVYLPLGFCEEYGLQRMVRPATVRLSAAARGSHGSRRMTDADFADVLMIDRDVFGADRRALLEMCRSEAPEYAAGRSAQVASTDICSGGTVTCSSTSDRSSPAMKPLLPARRQRACRGTRTGHLSSTCRSARRGPRGWSPPASRLQRPFTRMRRGEPRAPTSASERMFAIAGPEFG